MSATKRNPLQELTRALRLQKLARALIEYVEPDPMRAGLAETPERWAKAIRHYTSGYDMDPALVLKAFEDGSEDVDELVVQTGIPFWSLCEHHIAPFFGTVAIGYIPNKRIVGLSKLSRLTEGYARRLQVQERLTVQIATALEENLTPLGVGVVVHARHSCMESRGIQKAGCVTTTSRTTGVLRTDAQARNEFLSLAAQSAAAAL